MQELAPDSADTLSFKIAAGYAAFTAYPGSQLHLKAPYECCPTCALAQRAGLYDVEQLNLECQALPGKGMVGIQSDA